MNGCAILNVGYDEMTDNNEVNNPILAFGLYNN